MELLIDKMGRASAWILGSPVYFFAPTAQLKAFLDRGLCVPKEVYRDTDVLSVFALGDTTPDGAAVAADLLRRTVGYHGANYVGEVIAHEVFEPGDVLEKQTFMQAAFEAGKSLIGRSGAIT